MKVKPDPIIVEALQFKGNLNDMWDFCGLHINFEDGEILLDTVDGEFQISNSDWVIKYIDGGYSLLKPSLFEKYYYDIGNGKYALSEGRRKDL